MASDKALDPAASVIAKFGGVPTVARLLGCEHSTVSRWTYPRSDGGTGGQIPTRRQHELLELAKASGVDLSPMDFFGAAA